MSDLSGNHIVGFPTRRLSYSDLLSGTEQIHVHKKGQPYFILKSNDSAIIKIFGLIQFHKRFFI